MLTTILFAATIGLILLVWFRTDAWLEYTEMLHLNFLSFYRDYNEKLKDDATLTYHIYLRRYHNSFLTRLITCPICLAIWIGSIFSILQFIVILSLAIVSVAFVPVAVISLFSAPIHILLGLFFFAVIDKLLS